MVSTKGFEPMTTSVIKEFVNLQFKSMLDSIIYVCYRYTKERWWWHCGILWSRTTRKTVSKSFDQKFAVCDRHPCHVNSVPRHIPYLQDTFYIFSIKYFSLNYLLSGYVSLLYVSFLLLVPLCLFINRRFTICWLSFL